MSQYDVIIIGGGTAGLAAAWRLQQQAPHLKAALFEKHDQFGGKIQTTHDDGFLIEAGPDSFLARKPRGVGLCEELGLADALIGRDPAHKKTFVLRNGRLHPLPEGLTGMIPTNLDALTHSTLLSEAGRQAIAAEPEQPVPSADVGDESLAQFVTRRFGREAFENLIEPLMGGIYAGQASQLSLAATFPQLRQLELKHGSLLKGLTERPSPSTEQKYPPFVSLAGGMGQLVETLVEKLDGVELVSSRGVTAIEPLDSGYRLTLEDGTAVTCRQLIIATPAFIASRLLQSVDVELAAKLDSIPYASSALVNLTYIIDQLPDPLDGYGYVIPNAEEKEALACTWSSRKWNDRAPEGKLLLRVYIGRFGLDVTQYEDGRLRQIALDELRDTLGIETKPERVQIDRWHKGMPQYNMGHLERVEAIEERVAKHPNLGLAGNYFRGVGIPDAILMGETAVESLLAQQVQV